MWLGDKLHHGDIILQTMRRNLSKKFTFLTYSYCSSCQTFSRQKQISSYHPLIIDPSAVQVNVNEHTMSCCMYDAS